MLKIGVGQLSSSSNPLQNGLKVAKLIQGAYSAGCKALFLPEASDYIAGSPAETIALAQPLDSSDFMKQVYMALAKYPLHVSVGVHEPSTNSQSRVRNVLLWINPRGEIVNRYQKMHLFDVDVPNGPVLRESKSVEPGTKFPTVIAEQDLAPFAVGPEICYDIRFPETARELVENGANVLIYPSAFTIKTGKAHWETLNRSRAIDNQCFVVSAAQVGQHDKEGKRASYGHSLVVDPWGEVLLNDETVEDEHLSVVELDYSVLQHVRANMPLAKHRENVPGKYAS